MDSALRLLTLDSFTLSRSSFSRASMTGSMISYPSGGGLLDLLGGMMDDGWAVDDNYNIMLL